VDNAGESPDSTDREVVRYAVYPGQACSFKVGANRIVAAREAALADRSRPHPMWSAETTLRHFIDTITAMLAAPLDPSLDRGNLGGGSAGGKPRAVVGSVGMILD
ncbi:MAG: hypothetical protein ACK4S3_03370, partial [Parvibaculum sp.]